MTASDDGPPHPCADAQLLAVDDAPVAVWECVHCLAETAEACLVSCQRHFVPAGGPVEVHAIRGRLAPGVGDQHATDHVLETRGPQPAVVLSGEPAGHADVIR